jgi:hypothetical protein
MSSASDRRRKLVSHQQPHSPFSEEQRVDMILRNFRNAHHEGAVSGLGQFINGLLITEPDDVNVPVAIINAGRDELAEAMNLVGSIRAGTVMEMNSGREWRDLRRYAREGSLEAAPSWLYGLELVPAATDGRPMLGGPIVRPFPFCPVRAAEAAARRPGMLESVAARAATLKQKTAATGSARRAELSGNARRIGVSEAAE